MNTWIVCIDGTGNSPWQTDQEPDGDEALTAESNVLRIVRFAACLYHPDPAVTTDRSVLPLGARLGEAGGAGAVFYRWGVGTELRGRLRGLEQATGMGISDRIQSAYQFLASHHEPGDRIFAFGFSRGAFAVRSMAGFLRHVGLPVAPRVVDDDETSSLFKLYRKRASDAPLSLPGFRPAAVDFLGIWDTVGALAFPDRFGDFHDISPAGVGVVAHALALDEQRPRFTPDFWRAPSSKVSEVWFTGAHSNIGGGYANDELSNIALAWMVSRAVAAGLPAPAHYIDGWYNENAFRRTRDSHAEFLKNLGFIGSRIKGPAAPRRMLPHQQIHTSVFDRIDGKYTSDYVTNNKRVADDQRLYVPAALLPDGSAISREQFTGHIDETPDYLL